MKLESVVHPGLVTSIDRDRGCSNYPERQEEKVSLFFFL